KLDAPSGTAVKTLDIINSVREEKTHGHPEEYEVLDGARGAKSHGVHVHSVRLHGLVAHQEVIFCGDSQLFTLNHDSFDRVCFMYLIYLSIDNVLDLSTLLYGL